MADGVGERVAEVTSRRTVESKTYRLDTGELETVIGAGPLHYPDGRGRLVDLDTTLVRSDRGFAPVSSPRQVSVPTTSSGNVSMDGLTFTLDDAREVKGVPGEEGRVTFAGVFDAVDWQIWSHASGVGEDLVLQSEKAIESTCGRVGYTIGGVDGLKPVVTETGAVQYGETVQIGAPFARDTAGAETSAVWEVTDTGLVMVLPVEWLSSAERVWPVVVDPDVVTLTGYGQVADAYLAESDPDGTRGFNWGVNVAPAPYVNRGLFSFDVRDAFDEPVRVSEAYVSATIGSGVAATGHPQVLNVFELDCAFVEGQVTWNNAATGQAWSTPGGDIGDAVWSTSNLDGAAAGTKVKLHLADTVQRWLDDDDDVAHGVLVQHANEANTGGTATTVGLSSSQSPTASYRPELVIKWNPLTGNRSNETSVPFELAPGMTANVNVASGNLHIAQTDHSLPGRGQELTATRFYNSRGLYPLEDAGFGWSVFPSGYSRLRALPNGDRQLHGAGLGDARFSYDRENADPGRYLRPVGLVADLRTDVTPHTLTFPQSGEVWSFNATSGMLMSIDDGNGNTVTVAYQAGDADRVATVTHADGNQLSYTYIHDNLITKIQDNSTLNAGQPRTTVYGYPNGSNGKWILDSVTDRAGNTISMKYTSNNQLHRVYDANGNLTHIRYDTEGRISGIDRDGTGTYTPDWTFVYGETSGVATGTSDGRDAAWKTTVTDPNSNTTVYHYNRRGEVLRTIDGAGHVRDGDVSARGFAIQNFKPAAGGSYGASNSTFAYEEVGTSTAATDSLTSVTDADGGITKLGYVTEDGNGDPSPTRYSPTSVEDPYARMSLLDYNAKDDTNQNTNSGPGRPRRTTGPDGAQTDIWYRSDGQVDLVKKPAANPSGSTAMETDRPEVDYIYNAAGQLTSVDLPAPLVDPTYTYDAVGRVSSTTDGNADTTTYTYDLNDRIVAATHTTSGDVISTVYDDAGNAVQQVSDPAGPDVGGSAAATFYTYDGHNRAVTETFPGRGQTSYTYDEIGNLTVLATSLNGGGAANVVSYTYDARNLVDTITVPDTSDVIDLDHDPAGFRTTTTYPGGITIDAAKDNMDRLDTLVATDGTTDWLNRDHTYTDGQLTAMNDLTGDVNWSYDYDVRDRLKRAVVFTSDPAKTFYQTYSYDRRSNRTKLTDGASPSTTTTFTHNLADQLTSSTAHGTFTYDNVGQQLVGNNLTLAYNDRGQMTAATPAGVTAQDYGYANNGQTNRLDINGTAVTPSLRGVQSLDGGYSPIETLRDPSGGLLAIRQRSAGTWNYVIADHLGSVRALATAAGATTATYDYGPWGTTISSSGSFAGQNPYRYVGTLGYHTDTTTGLIKAGARYYQPELGRWTQQDPSGQEANAYLYATANPTNRVDPSGYLAFSTRRIAAEILYTIASKATCGATAALVTAIQPSGPIAGLLAGIACNEAFGLFTELVFKDYLTDRFGDTFTILDIPTSFYQIVKLAVR